MERELFQALEIAQSALRQSMPKWPTPVGKAAHAKALQTVTSAVDRYRKENQ